MSDNKTTQFEVACPNCSKTIIWNEQQKWRPFCSERCRLIDLGEWADEGHRIPGESHPLGIPEDE